MSLRPGSLALISALALGAAPAVATAAPAAPAVVHVVKAPVSAPVPATDASAYAAREAQDKKVANYEGGSVVVIGISGGALVVLLLLLLIL